MLIALILGKGKEIEFTIALFISTYLSHSSVHKVTNVMNIRLKMNM
jgi:hypothetical protein